ncbi:DUF4038 domain-containing protein [Qingshengfaniella alkalisoli]|nr:DUF4038 domain-containing protein [Qingshengfaniella alkalisoli]
MPTRFSLAVSADKTHLVDKNGRPFFINGDAAWSLIAELTLDEAEHYLQDRKARGFNALLVSLIEHHYSSNPPNNIYGDPPFTKPDSFDQPDAAYFNHAHDVLERAQALGFVVFLAPSYIGVNYGSDGWYREMVENGPESLSVYADFVVRRFADLDNIIWTHGGDWDAPDKTLINAMAEAIAAADPDALQTVHSNRDTVTADLWKDASWLDIDTAYTYGDTARKVQEHLRGDYGLPVILIESLYENERGTTTQMLREAAYGAVVAGAAGTFFGNNPIWNFNGRELFETDRAWQEELSSPGAQSMTHMRAFFESIPWWKLRADDSRGLCGFLSQRSGNRCAATQDRRLSVIYMSRVRSIQVSPEGFADGPICGDWYDPRTGHSHVAFESLHAGSNRIDVRPDASMEDDWLLVLSVCETDPFTAN